MDYTCRTKTLQAITKDIEKNNIVLSHKLQRPEGQWNRKQKSDLIDSLLRKYPINPTYAVKENKTLSVIDGVQRISCVRDFVQDKFSLSKNMEPVYVNDDEKNLSGLKFSKLDDDTKDAILNSELQIYELTDFTEKDVREMFRRQNAGKPLNGKLMRVVYESEGFSDHVYSLANHPFIKKLMTNAQRKNGTDRDSIIQTLMLISTDKENNFTTFRKNDIDTFVLDYADSIPDDKFETLKTVLDKLDESFEKIKIPVTSVPMVFYSGYRVVKDKKSFTKFVELVNKFLAGYDTNEDYKQFVQAGTGAGENVNGRFEWWKDKIKAI